MILRFGRKPTYSLYRKTKTKAVNTLMVLAFAASIGSGAMPLLFQSTAAAATTVTINNVSDLRNAIENQADGQIWNIAAGNYGLSPFNGITAGCPSSCQTGWYMPITANDITIDGAGQGSTTLYGTGFTANGNWSTQNFVSIFGDNITIKDLTLMPKIEPNKTIEVLGSDATIKNVTITPNTLTDQTEYDSISDPGWAQEAKQWGGSLYFSHAGNHTIDNVTIKNGGISYRYTPSGTNISLTDVTLDYATNVDWINGYRYSSGFNNPGNSLSGAPKVVYHVNNTLNNLNEVMDNYKASDTIELDSNINTSKQITLDKDHVTFNGNGHTIFPQFTKTDNDNNSALGIQADDVIVNNLNVDGIGGTTLHGINIFNAQNIALNDVQSSNNDRTGVNINGSAVTVNNITTANNSWHGLDVDKAGAVLTVNGVSHHTEVVPDIYIDDISIGQVVDTNNQYSYAENVLRPGDRVYTLKLQAPANLRFEGPAIACGGSTNINWTTAAWDAVPGAAGYDYHVDGPGGLTYDTSLTATSHSGTFGSGVEGLYTFKVRAFNIYGVRSAWSSPCGINYDHTAPAAPNNLRLQIRSNGNFVTNNGWTNHADVTALWNSNNTEPVTYEYQYWNDVPTSPYNSGNHWKNLVSNPQYPGTVNQGDGLHHYCVVAIDLAGNRSACSAQFNFNYDSTAPVTDIHVSPVVGGVFTVSGDASDNLHLNRVYVQLVYRGTSTRCGGTTINLIPFGASHSWSKTYDIATLMSTTPTPAPCPEGTYAAHVAVVDMAGNSSSAGWTTDFLVDKTAPTGTVTYTGGTVLGDTIYLSTINDLKYHASMADNLGLEHTSYAVWKTDSNFTNSTKVLYCGNWNHATTSVYSISGTSATVNGDVKDCNSGAAWPDGYYLISHVVYDQAGNLTYFSAHPYPGQKFVVDSSAPSVPTALLFDNNNASVPDGGYIITQNFRFDLTSGPGTTRYQLKYWNDIPGSSFNGQSNAWSPNNLSSAGHMATLGTYTDLFTQGEGKHYFAFSACDAAGNCSAFSTPFEVTYDTTAPDAPASAEWDNPPGTVNATGYTNVNNITPTWAASTSGDVDHYEYSFTRPTDSNWSAPSNVGNVTDIPNQVFGAGGAGNGEEGPWQFRVRTVDGAGNTSPWTTSPVIIYDHTAPTAPGIPTTTSPTTNFNSNWTWTAATDLNGIKGYLFDLTDSSNNSVASYPTTTPSVPTSLATAVLATGTYQLHVRAVDNAGNVSPESVGTVVVVAPQISSTNTFVRVTNNNNQTAQTGNANVGGNTTGGNAGTGNADNTAVLGTDVTVDNTGDSDVLGDSTQTPPTVGFANVNEKSGKFLGFGWWWLILIPIVFGLFWFLLGRRRRDDEEKA